MVVGWEDCVLGNQTDIYIPMQTDGHELCHPLDLSGLAAIETLINGTRRSASWQPIAIQIVGQDRRGKLEPSDSPWLGAHALIFRPSALDVMGPLLHPHGEHLPLRCEQDQLWVFNPTCVVDALDPAASVVQRFRDGQIWGVSKYAFRARAIVGLDVFKISTLPVSPTFVTGRIVERWSRAGLRGVEFCKVWSPR